MVTQKNFVVIVYFLTFFSPAERTVRTSQGNTESVFPPNSEIINFGGPSSFHRPNNNRFATSSAEILSANLMN